MQVSNSFFDVVRQYFAECALLPVFALSFIWLFKRWDKNARRALIAIGCCCIVVFNEITYRIFGMAGEGITYYRLFWILPILLVTAAFFVDCIMSVSKEKRILMAGILGIFVWMSMPRDGREWFAIPESIYQLDANVIQVADALMETTNGQPVYFIDDGSISTTVRQYDARIMSTDMNMYAMDIILQGYDTNVLAKDAQEAIVKNRSRYIAIRKSNPIICKVMENAGVKLANETDNYHLYYVHYDRLWMDLDVYAQAAEEESLLTGSLNIEYVPIAGFEEELEYVYLTDFGSSKEDVYQEALEKIKCIHPDGVIINNQLSKNRDWHQQYENILEELDVPYYCNDMEFQVISTESVNICMMDNREAVSETALTSLKELINEGKPIVLVLSKRLEQNNDAALFDVVTSQDSQVIQVLSAESNTYHKTLLNEQILQYASPADSGQLLNIIRIEGLEPKEIIAY